MMPHLPLTCEAFDATLEAYVSNTLPDAEAEALEAHVSECTRCEGRLEAATRLDLSSYAPPLPPAVRASVLAAAGARPARLGRARWWRGMAATAAMAAAAVLWLRRAPEAPLVAAPAAARADSTTLADRQGGAVPVPEASRLDAGALDPTAALRGARALAREEAASEFQSLDAAARELESALQAAPDDREMRAYLDAVRARRAELTERIAEVAS